MSFKKLFLLYFVFILISSIFISSAFSSQQLQRKQSIGGTRKLFSAEDTDDEEIQKPKKKKTIKEDEDTQIIKPKKKPIKEDDQEIINPKKKPIKEGDEGEIQILKPKKKTNSSSSTMKPITKNSSKNTTISISLPKTVLVKKLNSTKSSSSSTNYTKKSQDLSKPISTSKNKTPELLKSKNPDMKTKTLQENKIQTQKKIENKPKKPITPIWMLEDDTTDFISEFTDLPSRFQQTLIPDLERMSTKSKAYINRANKEITEGYIKPYIGNTNAKKYAPQIASIISAISILVPLILVSLIFNKIKTYFSLQKIIIFIQIYLSIYFSILSLSALITGLEPLKFFFATSQSRYICLQILQTLGYVLYLLLLLMYLVLVFSTETGLSTKVLGLGQTIVGFAVGVHYYVTVFHRAVLNQPPKSNWKINGVYAVCFLVICVFAGAERRKKAYLEDGGDEGKKS